MGLGLPPFVKPKATSSRETRATFSTEAGGLTASSDDDQI
jgi:hypothetical protein